MWYVDLSSTSILINKDIIFNEIALLHSAKKETKEELDNGLK